MPPKVSIIVPSYNYAKFLPFALDSIMAQTMTDWECVIVDDGSKDDTWHVARAYVNKDGRFRYVYQQNSGLSAARNMGMNVGTGEYLQFLDADDMIDAEKLYLQSAYLDKHPEVDILYGDEGFFHTDSPDEKLKGRDKSYNREQYLKVSGSGEALVKALSVNNFISVSSPLVRRSLVAKVGNFDTSYKSYEDWHFWFRAAVAGATFLYEPIPGSETYIRYGHTSMLTNKVKLVEAGIRMRKFMMPKLPLSRKGYNAYRMLKLYTRKLFQSSIK